MSSEKKPIVINKSSGGFLQEWANQGYDISKDVYKRARSDNYLLIYLTVQGHCYDSTYGAPSSIAMTSGLGESFYAEVDTNFIDFGPTPPHTIELMGDVSTARCRINGPMSPGGTRRYSLIMKNTYNRVRSDVLKWVKTQMKAASEMPELDYDGSMVMFVIGSEHSGIEWIWFKELVDTNGKFPAYISPRPLDLDSLSLWQNIDPDYDYIISRPSFGTFSIEDAITEWDDFFNNAGAKIFSRKLPRNDVVYTGLFRSYINQVRYVELRSLKLGLETLATKGFGIPIEGKAPEGPLADAAGYITQDIFIKENEDE